jgi:DNA-binding SARP family transcriptional activator/EAL domain-containing protein (putative c-di-GMP-specific phosphodiesterase class I)
VTTPRTRIVLLGGVGIDRDAVPAAAAGLPGRRSELVFAYLALERGRSVSRDELAEALWPELLPETWNAALRSVLSDVRRYLERAGLDPAATLVTEQGRLRSRLPDDAVVDIDEARAALAGARELLAAGEAAAAAEAAGRASDLSDLPFLPHHEGGWADGIRSDLDELHVRALEVQAAALARACDARAALAAADRLVRADPFLEAAHRLRIELLGETGDRAGAVKAYERCKALLVSELGIDPSPATETALRRALDGIAPPSAAPATRFGAYSVLVVEDHDFQRRTALALLRGLGVGTLREAADGVAALELLEASGAPDVIVCDIDMPGMDGVEFIRHVAERRLACAVAIASGLDRRLLEAVRAVSEGYGLQVLGAVGKPLTARALEELLAAYQPPPEAASSAGDTSAAVAALVSSLDDGTLTADFEPIVDLALGSITGVRAVARWPAAPAGDVLAAVDGAGVGRRFAEHLLRSASDAVREVDVEAWIPLPPSVQTDVSLADALAAVASDRVVLVVSAAGYVRGDSPAALDVLARLRVKGYGICLDAFGSGSALLERLPLTHALLPARLVSTAAATGDAARLQEAIDAARAVDVRAIARCATTAEFELLLRLGCSLAFGPFLAAPVQAAQLPAGVRDWTAPPVASDGVR